MGNGTEKQRRGPGAPDMGPDATQPRVTVRPKPPVLLGATSTMGRWHRARVVSDKPGPSRPRRLQGSHRTHHGPSPVGSSRPLRSRSPCGARSLPSIPPCSVLSASPRSALRLPFGLPSLPPCGARLRFGGLSFPTGDTSRHPQHRVNGVSRNPYVLPIFLCVIPKNDLLRPQFFPIVSPTRRQRRHGITTGSSRCSAGRPWAQCSGSASSTPAPAPTISREPIPLHRRAGRRGRRHGRRAADAIFDPPALSDPSSPGFTINSGADRPDPSCAAGRPLLPLHLTGRGTPERAGPLRHRGGAVTFPDRCASPTRRPGPSPA